MHIAYSLPTDHDGFLRRQCPTCLHYFKMHDGPANEEAEAQVSPSSYFCPLCGVSAKTDQWFTEEQVSYLDDLMESAAAQAVNEELASAFKNMRTRHFKIEKTGDFDVPDKPDPLVEPDDMTIVASPCHSWEPVKVPTGTVAPIYCLICGAAYAL
jgi:rubredoxin